MEKQVLEWWNNLSLEEQIFKTYKVKGFNKYSHRLTTEEIIEVYQYFYIFIT